MSKYENLNEYIATFNIENYCCNPNISAFGMNISSEKYKLIMIDILSKIKLPNAIDNIDIIYYTDPFILSIYNLVFYKENRLCKFSLRIDIDDAHVYLHIICDYDIINYIATKIITDESLNNIKILEPKFIFFVMSKQTLQCIKFIDYISENMNTALYILTTNNSEHNFCDYYMQIYPNDFMYLLLSMLFTIEEKKYLLYSYNRNDSYSKNTRNI